MTVLCHFPKIERMPVISCLTTLTFLSLFHVISIWSYVFKEITGCVLV